MSRIDEEISSCLCALASDVSPRTSERVARVSRRIGAFLTAHRLTELKAMDAELAARFVWSPLSSGAAPGTPTMHDRRTTLRLLFRAARRLALASHDPTLDLQLPARSDRPARPLTDDEVDLARDVSLWSLSGRRIAAAWALAEATGRGAELALVQTRDVDLAAGRVWLHGGTRTVDRWGELSDWGVRVLHGRLAPLGPCDAVVYSGSGRGAAGQVSTCQAISTILVRAGLVGEPDIRPMSVAAWAGRNVLDRTGDIAAVARALGVRSLDQAARLVGWDWSE